MLASAFGGADFFATDWLATGFIAVCFPGAGFETADFFVSGACFLAGEAFFAGAGAFAGGAFSTVRAGWDDWTFLLALTISTAGSTMGSTTAGGRGEVEKAKEARVIAAA